MKKVWGVIIIVVLIAIMVGVVAVGVGLITGAEMGRIYSTLQDKYVIDMSIRWINTVIEAVNSVIAA